MAFNTQNYKFAMFYVILLQCFLFKFVISLSQHPILIIVSYDAFRYNFFKKGISPQMVELRSEGTYADYIENVFPTKTFPNHHTIVTGVYPETHGVVDNSFFDPKLNRIVKFEYEMYNYNPSILPIWTLNEKAGRGRYSGSMMWPGGAFPFNNITPTHVQTWNPEYDWYKRVDDAISWIMHPSKPANLIMLYIEEPDTHGHVYGPDSIEVEELIKKLDNVTWYLETKLIENKLKNKVNVIHLSDHGMLSVSPPNFIDITTYLTNGTYEIAGASPVLHVIAKTGYEDEVYSKLKNASKINGHFTVYNKLELLPRWHYRNNPRIASIVVLAEVGYAFQDLSATVKQYAVKYNIKVTDKSKFGVHGYDYNVAEMRPFFMARGPQIKKRNYVNPFHTVDLFNLFCEIINIRPPSNNGSTTVISKIVIGKKSSHILSTVITAAAATLAALLLVVLCAVAVTIATIKRQQNITTAAALNKRFQQNFNHSSIEAQHLLEPEDA